jgi:hypothetical protein
MRPIGFGEFFVVVSLISAIAGYLVCLTQWGLHEFTKRQRARKVTIYLDGGMVQHGKET